MAITKRSGDKVELGPIDKEHAQTLSRDKMMRAIMRLPPAEMKAYVQRYIPEGPEKLTDADIDSVVRLWKRELEEDPLSLLDPPWSSGESGEIRILKGFSRETGLYVATLTGSLVYTDSDTQWARLHETDVHCYEPDPTAMEVIRCSNSLHIDVPTFTYHHQVEPSGASGIRALLRSLLAALREGVALDVDAQACAEEVLPPEEEGLIIYKLRASMPRNGFQCTDVSRLVLTFGRPEDMVPVQLGLFLEPVLPVGNVQEGARRDDSIAA